MKRVIYTGGPIRVEVWNQGQQPDYNLTYGMTGEYIGNTFIPDDKECPSFNIKSKHFYFPRR